MKTRIKVVEYKDGHKEYYPQYKLFFFWCSFIELTLFAEYTVWYKTIEDAQQYIDNALKHESYSTVKSITYIKYP